MRLSMYSSLLPLSLIPLPLATSHHHDPGKSNSSSIHVVILSGPLAPGTHNSFELTASRRALLKLKDNLGPSAILSTLQPDIAASNAAWHSILASPSTAAAPVLAEAYVRGTLPAHSAGVNFTAASFAAWFGASAAGGAHKLLAAHPEHYLDVGSGNADGTARVEIVEGWGGLITHYVLARYGPAGSGPGHVEKWPFMRALPDWPQQSVGEASLADGSGAVFAWVHNSIRDARGEGGRPAVEALLDGWLVPGTPENVVEALREHQAVEFSNWMAAAYEDIATGQFVP